ncbi:Lsr2 family protein [Microbacterium aerolatum]|uniref:histone-like nucleoid-structuring protein Lsr2 n=1 Tax=Microbacterium aerolatum TaxID=153731 RepID=UPI0038506CB3
MRPTSTSQCSPNPANEHSTYRRYRSDPHGGWSDITYEIDLSSANAAKLQDALVPFSAAGRRVRRHTRGAPQTGQPTTSAIREWARAKGYTVSDRSRVAANIVAAYRAA